VVGLGSVAEQCGGRVASGIRLERLGRRDSWLALVFHHVSDGLACPASDPRILGLNVDIRIDEFERTVDYLSRRYDIVPLDEAVSATAVRRGAKRRLLLCFDDAYASVPKLVAPFLARRGLPWVYFVNPGLVTGSTLAIDNQLAYVANTAGLRRLSEACGQPVDSVRDVITRLLPRMSLSERTELAGRLTAIIGTESEKELRADLYMSVDELNSLHQAGVEIGNHTRDHVHCRILESAGVDSQIRSSATDLRAMTPAPIRTFAYPYGSKEDATAQVKTAVTESGHEYAFLVQGRLNTSRTPPQTLFRVSLTASDAPAIAWQTSVLPRLRSLLSSRRGEVAGVVAEPWRAA
jgi:peptidoglycan/xylan/chitin deacetylase (PgdA/CDA1 family)